MIGAVEHGALDVHHGIPCQEALGHGLLHTLVHGRDQAIGNDAALDLIHEFIPGTRIRRETQPAITELPCATGLLLMAPLSLSGLADGLAVGDAHGHQLGIYSRLLL